ncbi:MAG TPA: aldo/keto reductase [Kofleriaceae bacterium]|nr:aldo/keto reductase [Kofleriaceae bacterium]
MRYGRIRGLDAPVSRIVLGTGLFPPIEVLDRFCALGGTAIDTGTSYPREAELGRWLARRPERDRLVVLGKGGHPRRGPDGAFGPARVTPSDLADDLESSLERLQLRWLDVFVAHRDDPDHDLEPIMEFLDSCVRRGRVRALGASNWSRERFARANEIAADRGWAPLVVASPQFSLAVAREPEFPGSRSVSGPGRRDERAWYEAHGVALWGWSPLACGFLAGGLAGDSPYGELRRGLWRRCYDTEDNHARARRLEDLARRRGATPAQIAIAYVLSSHANVSAVTTCSSEPRLVEDVGALDLELTRAELDHLEGPIAVA